MINIFFFYFFAICKLIKIFFQSLERIAASGYDIYSLWREKVHEQSGEEEVASKEKDLDAAEKMLLCCEIASFAADLR